MQHISSNGAQTWSSTALKTGHLLLPTEQLRLRGSPGIATCPLLAGASPVADGLIIATCCPTTTVRTHAWRILELVKAPGASILTGGPQGALSEPANGNAWAQWWKGAGALRWPQGPPRAGVGKPAAAMCWALEHK